MALLNKAKKAYIEDLKGDARNKAGLDFSKHKGDNCAKYYGHGIEYNTEDLSDNGKAQLASLQFFRGTDAKAKK